MFADSLLDSAYVNRSHRGWATLASFAAQALVVCTLLTMPLIYTDGLPRLSFAQPSVVPASRYSRPVRERAARSGTTSAVSPVGPLITPIRVPKGVPKAETTGRLTATEIPIGGPIGSCLSCPLDKSLAMIGVLGNAIVIPSPAVTHLPRKSIMMEGNLIHRVEPRYPPLAIQARIQGDVVLQAMISRSGMIENLQLVSGHPMLVRAAMDAVRQWRYRPYILNDEPIEVETQVTVKFVLNK